MTSPNKAQRRWVEGNGATPDRRCPAGCGARFFTRVGVEEHTRQGCGNGHGSPVSCRRAFPSAKQKAAWSASGKRVTALNNERRVRCSCGKVSTPAGVALHQRYSGHEGKAELGEPLAAAG